MVSRKVRIIYLHGFASSRRSRKAQFFSEILRSLEYTFEIPDLEQGDFEHLNITRQLRLIENTAHDEPVILMGSSMGGYVAALYAARHPEVDRLLLLAPAFGLYQLWIAELSPERLETWKRKGSLLFFHYGAGRELPLGYQFMEDARRFEPFPDVSQPVLIFHGNHDASVPVEQSLAFVGVHPNARLIRLESDHELTDVLATIWEQSKSFIFGAHDEIV
jgi:uncharacterized protein